MIAATRGSCGLTATTDVIRPQSRAALQPGDVTRARLGIRRSLTGVASAFLLRASIVSRLFEPLATRARDIVGLGCRGALPGSRVGSAPASQTRSQRQSDVCGDTGCSCGSIRRTALSRDASRSDLAVHPRGPARRDPRRDDGDGRRLADDADPRHPLRLRREVRRRHRHPARRDLQVVRRRAAPDARHRARAARALDVRSARGRCRCSACRSRAASARRHGLGDAARSSAPRSSSAGSALLAKTFVQARGRRRPVPAVSAATRSSRSRSAPSSASSSA